MQAFNTKSISELERLYRQLTPDEKQGLSAVVKIFLAENWFVRIIF
jgi:hypothetical protein